MQHLDDECVGLTLHLHQGVRPPAADATPLRLSRALEQRVADVEGPKDVRHWLQLIGHGEEHEWIDLGTVGGWGLRGGGGGGEASGRLPGGAACWMQAMPGHSTCMCHCTSTAPLLSLCRVCPLQVRGYRRIVFCQEVRDDVEGALGAGAWADLLPRMCEGRLVPTPWLNKVWGRGVRCWGEGRGGADGRTAERILTGVVPARLLASLRHRHPSSLRLPCAGLP